MSTLKRNPRRGHLRPERTRRSKPRVKLQIERELQEVRGYRS